MYFKVFNTSSNGFYMSSRVNLLAFPRSFGSFGVGVGGVAQLIKVSTNRDSSPVS